MLLWLKSFSLSVLDQFFSSRLFPALCRLPSLFNSVYRKRFEISHWLKPTTSSFCFFQSWRTLTSGESPSPVWRPSTSSLLCQRQASFLPFIHMRYWLYYLEVFPSPLYYYPLTVFFPLCSQFDLWSTISKTRLSRTRLRISSSPTVRSHLTDLLFEHSDTSLLIHY